MIERNDHAHEIATSHHFDSIDEDTAALIIQLQLEDSEAIIATAEGKGKGREGELHDVQVALQLYRGYMQQVETFFTDRKMTKSIAQACQTDGNIVTASRSEEQTFANDHELACRLSGQPVAKPVDPWTITAEEMDEELMAKLTALYVKAPSDQHQLMKGKDYGASFDGERVDGNSDIHEAESSDWAAARKPEAFYRTCESCRESVRYFEIARVPCGHEYCRDCLRELYSHAITDDTLFPPRCCRQPITSSCVRVFLPSELFHQYEQKKIELDTPNRTYCSNPTCSIFIYPENIVNDQATCPDCGATTCTMCKLEGHSGDCPSDLGLQQVLDTANENGWQRCYKCRGLVELEHGCNHMTFVPFVQHYYRNTC